MTPYEEISKNYGTSTGKPDTNLSNDSNKLGGIEAEEYATKKWVKDYHEKKENKLKEDINKSNKELLDLAKEYANGLVRDIDYTNYMTKSSDLPALKEQINNAENNAKESAKEYTNTEITKISNNINNQIMPGINNLKGRLSTAEGNIENLFQSVSDGKYKVAKAITDKGVQTLAKDSFETMANNIKAIKQEGVGNITITGTDTSDATASSLDILAGKTAYVDGSKIIGMYVPPSPSVIDYGTGNVEPIYETIASEVKVQKRNFLLPSNVNIYGISNSGTNLLGYNTTTNKLVFYELLNNGANYYFGKVVNQYEEQVTKEYSLEELGITGNKTVQGICFSATEINAVAIALLDTDTNLIELYIFKIKTNSYGHYEILTENSYDDKGIYSYSKWHIKTNATAIKDIKFSPYSSKLTVILLINKHSYFCMYELYSQYEETTESGYGHYYRVTMDDITINGTWEDRITRKIRLLNNEKLLSVYGNNGGSWSIWKEQRLYVLNSTYSIVGSTEKCNIDVTVNGKYAIDKTKLYQLNVNYENGNITLEELAEHGIDIQDENGGTDSGFTADNGAYFTNNHVYSVNFETKEINILDAANYTFIGLLPNEKTIMVRNGNERYDYITNEYDTNKLVGIRYNGIEWIKKGADINE